MGILAALEVLGAMGRSGEKDQAEQSRQLLVVPALGQPSPHPQVSGFWEELFPAAGVPSLTLFISCPSLTTLMKSVWFQLLPL